MLAQLLAKLPDEVFPSRSQSTGFFWQKKQFKSNMFDYGFCIENYVARKKCLDD